MPKNLLIVFRSTRAFERNFSILRKKIMKNTGGTKSIPAYIRNESTPNSSKALTDYP